MAEDRKRGAVDRINSGVDAVKKARSAYKLARTAGTAAEVVSTSEIWVPIVIIVAIILIFVFIILLKGGGGGIGLGNEEPGSGGSPGSGNISSCQFTRAGQGYSIRSSILAGWINDAANAAEIPPAVLASVAMHESQNFLATYDNNSPEIRNDYYCESEGVSCTSVDRSDSLGIGECTQEHIQADIYRGGSGRVVTDRHRG